MKALLPLLLLLLAAPALASAPSCDGRTLPATADNDAGTVTACIQAPDVVAQSDSSWLLTATLQAPKLLGAPPADALQLVATASGCSLGAASSSGSAQSLARTWTVTLGSYDCRVLVVAYLNNTSTIFVTRLTSHVVVQDTELAMWLPAVVLGVLAGTASWRQIKTGNILYSWIVGPAIIGLFGILIPALRAWVYVGAIGFFGVGLLVFLFGYRLGIRPNTVFIDPNNPKL